MRLASKKFDMRMSVAGSVVFLGFLRFLVARSKEFLILVQVVAGPLIWEWEDECVSKVILVLIFGGAAPDFATGGRATLTRSREFDNTMGYPGEDVHRQFSPHQAPSFPPFFS